MTSTPAIPSIFFKINKISEKVRLLFIGTTLSSYGLILYQVFPDHFLGLAIVYYFVIPAAASIVIGLILPRVFPNLAGSVRDKGSTAPERATNLGLLQTSSFDGVGESHFKQDTGAVTALAEKKEEAVGPLAVNPNPPITSPNRNPDHSQNSLTDSNEQASHIGIDKLDKRIDEKIKTVTDDVASIRNDLNALKENVQNLSSLFESSLTDLKAFQAELVNPINFMRKYFETIDINNLSDPTRMLPSLEIKTAKNESSGERLEHAGAGKDRGNVAETADKDIDSATVKGVSADTQHNASPGALKGMLNNNLTLGKMMALVTIVDEALRNMGPDGIDLIVAQYRMLGLKVEDERTIYNIVTMLTEYTISTEDIIVMLYRFGQVMQINDKEADLIYSKLIAKRISGISASNTDATQSNPSLPPSAPSPKLKPTHASKGTSNS